MKVNTYIFKEDLTKYNMIRIEEFESGKVLASLYVHDGSLINVLSDEVGENIIKSISEELIYNLSGRKLNELSLVIYVK